MDTRRTTTAGVVYATFWSSGFIGAELGTRHAPALELLSWRYAIAAPLLLALCLARRVRATRRVLLQQVGLGVLCQFLYMAPVVSAVGHGVPAGTVALVAALQPMVVAVAAGPLLGERVRAVGWLGLGIGLVGVALVVAGDLSGGVPGWWLLAPVAGMLSLSAGTLLGRRWEPPSSLLLSIAVQTSVAAVGFAVLNGLVGTVSVPPSSGFWVAVAWTVVLSSFGGYGSYLFVLRQQGATRASTWLYLSPPITVVWAWLMFGERVGVFALAGLVVTAVGVVLVLRGSATAAAPPPAQVRGSGAPAAPAALPHDSVVGSRQPDRRGLCSATPPSTRSCGAPSGSCVGVDSGVAEQGTGSCREAGEAWLRSARGGGE